MCSAGAVLVVGVGNEVWGDQYLGVLRGFARWTRQERLAYTDTLQPAVPRSQAYSATPCSRDICLCRAANDGSHLLGCPDC